MWDIHTIQHSIVRYRVVHLAVIIQVQIGVIMHLNQNGAHAVIRTLAHVAGERDGFMTVSLHMMRNLTRSVSSAKIVKLVVECV